MSSDQQHRITYKAGITRTPSDFLCQDGELAECINLTTDNEELKPVVQPSEFMTIGNAGSFGSTAVRRLLYIHKFADSTRYIVGFYQEPQPTPEPQPLTDPTWTLFWTLDGTNYNMLTADDPLLAYVASQDIRLSSVGKTLVVADKQDGLRYFMWKAGSYKYLGELPDPQFDFWLKEQQENTVNNSGKYDGIITRDGNDHKLEEDAQEDFNDMIVGLYEKNKKQIAQKKAFCLPFFVRTALEMTDGTYTKVSQPILVFPCVSENSFQLTDGYNHRFTVFTRYRQLFFTQSRDFEDWSDIVKDVVVFVSNGIEMHDLSVDQEFNETTGFVDGIFRKSSTNASVYYQEEINEDYPYIPGMTAKTSFSLTKRRYSEMSEDIKSCAIFYRLCEVGRKAFPSERNMADFIETHTLENITSRDRLPDDFFSHNRLYPGYIYPFNFRLNIADVERGIFEGFDKFIAWDKYTTVSGSRSVNEEEPQQNQRYELSTNQVEEGDSGGGGGSTGGSGGGGEGGSTPVLSNVSPVTADYDFYVTIATDDGDVTVKHSATGVASIQGVWFFYPDPRAKHVLIIRDPDPTTSVGTVVCDQDLTEHKGLNGAYFFRGIPGVQCLGETDDDPYDHVVIPQYDNDQRERMPNHLITSVVNNPFVFQKEGYNLVGVGRILAMSTTTMALAQDQFGKTPLIVFSERGVWGMHVDSTGLYESIDPFTRDVLINPHNVIQTDGAVFFVSKRGLMVATDKGVRCVSEPMEGKPFNTSVLTGLATGTDWETVVGDCQTNDTFQTYIQSEKCVIAYDYIDSRLIITNPGCNFSYIMGLADGSISKTILPGRVTNVVNDYPDYLMQGTVTETVQGVDVTRNVLYTLYGKQREEAVSSRQTAFLLTRPMKLGGPVGKTSLRELLNVGFWDEGTVQTPLSCVKAKLYISDDMKNWYEDTSRFGAAAKYFRLALFIRMLPAERLSGTVIRTQDRRTDNMI